MSITLTEAHAFLATGKMMASPENDKKASAFQNTINALESGQQAVSWRDLFVRATDIFNIWNGPGTIMDKINATFALFNKPVPANISVG